ncbi:MAG: hypothetical protein R3A78_16060, partial [Polyangiales bacterium]
PERDSTSASTRDDASSLSTAEWAAGLLTTAGGLVSVPLAAVAIATHGECTQRDAGVCVRHDSASSGELALDWVIVGVGTGSLVFGLLTLFGVIDFDSEDAHRDARAFVPDIRVSKRDAVFSVGGRF